MGYPKDLLSAGEEVSFILRPHFRAILLPILWGVLVITGFGVVIYYVWAIEWLRWALLIITAVLVIITFITPFLRWLTTQYVFTTRRIIIRSGLIAKKGRDVPLSKVNNVSFNVTVLGRILNYGALQIDSANEDQPLIIEDVPSVEKIQKRVYDLYESDDARRRTPDATTLQQVAEAVTEVLEDDIRPGSASS